MIYRFKITRADGSTEVLERDLPDDANAIDWMGSEVLLRGESVNAFRVDNVRPFASREFGGDVALLT